MSLLQSNSEKSKKIGINSWSLMEIDDLLKYTILDPHMGFETKKMLSSHDFTVEDHNAVQQIIPKNELLDRKSIKQVEEALKSLFIKHKLYYKFNIKYSHWVVEPISFYLKTIASDSPVLIKRCTRYQSELKGLTVVAKVDIPKDEKLRCLAGIYKVMDKKREELLRQRNLNFSVVESSRISNPMLMLGTAALVNHDCNPNCIYYTSTKSLLIIVSTKNIKKGDELYCFYSKNYFGPGNENCECITCEKEGKGYFSKLNSAENSKNLVCKTACTTDLLASVSHVSLHESNKNMESILLRPNRKHEITIEQRYVDIEISKSRTEYNSELINDLGKNSENKDDFNSYKDSKQIVLYKKIHHPEDKQNLEIKIKAISQNKFGSIEPVSFNSCKILDKEIKCLSKLPEYSDSVSQYMKIDSKLSLACIKLVKINHLIVEYYTLKKYREDYTFCIFCETFKTQFMRHLKLVHYDKYIVNKHLNSQDNELKKSAANFIRNQGLAHFEQLTGIIIPVMKTRSDAVQKVEKVICDNCHAHFSKKTLWNHLSLCKKITPLSLRS